MERDKNWLEAVMVKDERSRSIVKVLTANTVPAVEKGDNFVSDMKRVVMDVVLGSGNKVKKSILIKEVPSTELRNANIHRSGTYIREITMFRDVLTSMEDVMEEKCGIIRPLWGRYITCTPYKRIVLEDLKQYGYKMHDRFEGLDLDHSLLVVRSLAKFHALSLVLKERHQISMDIFGLTVAEKIHDFLIPFQEEMFERFIKSIDENWGPEWSYILPSIKNINVKKEIGKIIKRDDTRFNVLIHGDCWINNLMFKYNYESRPTSLRFVDFQLCAFNSPAIDLQYFFNTSTNLDVRRNSKLHLVEAYHERLIVHMEELGFDKQKIPSFQEIWGEMQRLDFYGYLTAVSVLPLLLIGKAVTFPDFEKLTKEYQEGTTSPVAWIPINGEKYVTIMKQLTLEAYNNGVFSV